MRPERGSAGNAPSGDQVACGAVPHAAIGQRRRRDRGVKGSLRRATPALDTPTPAANRQRCAAFEEGQKGTL